MMAFAGGLALGIAASAHCAAMCGPLAIGLGHRLAAPSVGARLRYALLHHAGRILTYLLLALPAGLWGQRAAVDGLGRALSIAAGTVLLAMALGWARPRFLSGLSSACASLAARVSMPALRWAAARPVAGPLVAGMLNGLLPCGLVYAALIAACTAGGVAGAVQMMAGFGLGTLPVLVAMSLGAVAVPAAIRLRLRPMTPIVLVFTAVVLILRGAAVPHQHADPPRAAVAVHSHH